MKPRLLFTTSWLSLLTLLAVGLAHAQGATPARYTVIDLGTLGGSFSLAYAINDGGQIDGFSTLPGDTVVHSFLRDNGMMIDLGTLGGPNSQSFSGLNNATEVGGSSDTSISDPNGEDFCGFGTNLVCLGFVWQNGVLTPLSTLGGNNSQATDVNARGEVTGFAENSTPDPTCPPSQVLQFKPVVWTDGQIQALPDYPGDQEGVGFWINNAGDVVGASGSCMAYDGRYGAPISPKHALLWRHGKAIDLGNLGGGINNTGLAINDLDQVVGTSDLAGDQYQHAFLWQNGTISDMGTLSGDVVSAALAINNRRQVTGVSIDADGNMRAFLWQNGVMMDLNDLISANSPLYLLHGFGINSSGKIVGLAYVQSIGEVHAFLAVPVHGGGSASGAQALEAGSMSITKHALPENARKLLQQSLHSRLFAIRAAESRNR